VNVSAITESRCLTMIKTAALLTILLLASAPAIAVDASQHTQSASTVWDLTELYPTDAAWEAERKSIADALPSLTV
jgi:oligoendopeptidase F